MSPTPKRPASPSVLSESDPERKKTKLKCNKCGGEYTSQSYHNRSQCVTEVLCKYPNGDVLLKRVNGTFKCAHCTKALVKPSGIQSHAKTCFSPPSKNAGSPTRHPLSTPQVLDSVPVFPPTPISAEVPASPHTSEVDFGPDMSDKTAQASQGSPEGNSNYFTAAVDNVDGCPTFMSTNNSPPGDEPETCHGLPPAPIVFHATAQPLLEAKIMPGNHDRLGGILLSTPYVVNALHSALICYECKCVIPPSDASTHIRSNHLQCHIPRNFSSSLEIEFPGLHEDLAHPQQVVSPIFGLKIPECKYLICPVCFHGYKNEETLRRHVCKSSNDNSSENAQSQPFWSYVQTFLLGGKRVYFPIDLQPQGSSTIASQSSYQLYHSTQDSMDSENVQEHSLPEDFRQLHQFLRQEGWLDHVRVFSSVELAGLIALPEQTDQLSSIPDAVLSVVQLLQDEILVAGQFVRRQVGRRPTDGHTGVRHISHGTLEAPTLKRYAKAISQLVLFVLRCRQVWACEYRMELGEATAEKAGHLLSHLKSLPPRLKPTSTAFDTASGGGGEAEDVEGQEEEEEEEIDFDSDPPANEEVETAVSTSVTPGLTVRHLSTTQQLVLDVIESLYTQLPTGSNDKFYSPILRFIILSCYGKKGDWLTSRKITAFFSIFTFCGRLVMYNLMRSAVFENSLMRFSDAARHLSNYLDEDFEGPLPSLYLLRRPLDRVSMTEGAPFTFTAADFSGQNIIVSGKTLYIADVKHMVETLISELKTCLTDELLFGISDLIDVEGWDPGTVHEEPRNTRPAYCCLSDPHNPSLVPDDWLLKIVLDHPAVAGRFHFIRDGKIIWRSAPCLQYLQKCHDFEMKLFAAAHLTVGEPPRGTEFASQSLRNIPGGNIRNVFVLFQHLCLMGTFNKSTYTKSCILRVPLPDVSRLWLLYLSRVRPTVYIWQKFFNGASAAARAFNNLFFGFRGPVQSSNLSNVLEEHTQRLLGVSINISLWRHIVTWFLNHHAVKFHEFLSLSNRAVLAAQMGHSDATHRLYAADARLPAAVDFHTCFQSMKASGMWHDLLGFTPVLVNRLQESANRITSFSNGNPAPHSANGSTYGVSSLLKSVLLPELSRMQSHSRAADFASLVRFLKTEGSQPATVQDKKDVVSIHPHRLWALRRLLRDDSAFFKTPQQAEAVEAIASHEPSLLIIGPTGSGKTLPIMLNVAEYDRGRTTVLILPLLAMHEEYIERAKRFNISVETWKWNGSPHHASQLVLVAVESCPWESFKIYVSSLLSMGRLARLAVDEAHLLLKHKGFRQCVRLLQYFGRLAIPIILLTATCPPDMEPALFNCIGREVYYKVLRQATDRPEISQHLISIRNIRDETAFEQEVSNRIKQLASLLRPLERMLLFCLSHGQCDRMAELLEWDPYHAHIPPEDRLKSMDAWKRGSIKGLACTSMLNCCLDYPHVRYVFHLDLPRDAVDYYQAIGRCARDGAPGFSHVYYDPNNIGGISSSKDAFGRGIILEMAQNDKVCRRIRPGNFLDGFSAPCILTKNGVFCDNCERAASQPTDALPSVANTPSVLSSDDIILSDQTSFPVMLSAAYSATSATVVPGEEGIGNVVFNACEVLDKCCTYCWVDRSFSCTTHTLDRCTKSEALRLSDDYLEWIDNLVLPRGYCFYCGCSQRIYYQRPSMPEAQVHGHEASRNCHWQHIFKPISYFVYTMLKEDVETLIPEVEMDREAFITWLCSKDQGCADVLQLNRVLAQLCLFLPLPYVEE